MMGYAEEKYYLDDKTKDTDRYNIILDIFIKARNYYITNKIFFFLSLISCFLVITWPTIAIFTKDYIGDRELLNSSIIQSTITGIFAFTFAIYSHYKKKQMRIENLMRYILYSNDTMENILNLVIQEMRNDTGFNFKKNVVSKAKTDK